MARELVRWALALLLVAQSAHAQSPEYRLKAAFLLNFAKFVSWPEPEFSAQPKINICVVGSDPFGAELATIEGKKAQGHDIAIRREASSTELKSCHIVFVSVSEQPRLSQTLAAIGSASVLTVSDIPEFCLAGGMIALVTTGSRVQFEVNLEATEKAALKLHAQMLKLAKTIHRGKEKL